MSRILSNNLFGRPAGKTQGIIFSSARSRSGKVTTTRGLVKPTNPNTPAQQTQRSKFSSVQDIVRRLGPNCYKFNFDRTIGQLPGFQSLNSILLNQMNSNLDLILNVPIALGNLHFPDSISFNTSTPNSVIITFSTNPGTNGTANDIISFIAIGKTDTLRQKHDAVQYYSEVNRSEGSASMDFSTAGVYELYVFVIGQGNAEGLWSVCNPYEITIV